MKIQQLYTNCLAQGAYYIAHKGEAVIIDPLRETRPYLDLLAANKDQLKYVFETHFHADFVSGHVDLALETGATIVFGPKAKTDYASHVAKDGEEFKVGDLTIKVLHTPGHTLESSTFLLQDENLRPLCIFTGDTLFIGDVGRPDLAIKSDLTQEDLAGMLYESLRNKIMPLPDDVIVYPAHGAGSACGKSMSKDTFDTLGSQKKNNYALADISKAEFIKQLTEGILPAPQYFAKNAALNKSGYDAYDQVIARGRKRLSAVEFKTAIAEKDALVLDVRTAQEFAAAHIPGSLFIGLDGQFAPWVGTIIRDLSTPIYLVCPTGREEETIMRLARVGYDQCRAFLNGGFGAWKEAGLETANIESISAAEFMVRYSQGVRTIDVRKPGEYDSARLTKADNQPLDFIYEWLDQIDPHSPVLIHCAGGYRSMIAASLLKANGHAALTDVQGGFGAISKLPAAEKELLKECSNA